MSIKKIANCFEVRFRINGRGNRKHRKKYIRPRSDVSNTSVTPLASLGLKSMINDITKPIIKPV